jgi:hypothetical protein
MDANLSYLPHYNFSKFVFATSTRNGSTSQKTGSIFVPLRKRKKEKLDCSIFLLEIDSKTLENDMDLFLNQYRQESESERNTLRLTESKSLFFLN